MVMPSNVLLLDGWTVTSYSESPEQITFYADPPPSEKLCAHCKIPTLVVPHDERVLKIRDAPMRGKTVTIAVRQIRFRCRTCGKPFTPALPDLADDIPMTAHQIQKETERRARELSTRKAPKNGARHRIPKPVRTTLRLRMTKRCADFISVAAFRRPFAWVAREVGIDEKQVRRISGYYSNKNNKGGGQIEWSTKYLGIDDVWLGGKARTVLVDLESGKIIELLEGQKKDDVKALFKKIKNPEIIEVVCMDMASHFALSVRESLPADVVIIFDKWHVQRQALDAVAKARIYTQRYIKQTAGNDKARLLSAEDITIRMQKHRSLFLRRRHHAFAPGLEKLLHAYLEQYNGLSVAYNLKERFCEIWGSQNAKVAEARMDLWLNELEEEGRIYAEIYADAVANVKSGERLFYCDTDPLDLFRLVKRTITENRKYVLNYFEVDDRWTNAKSEAANGNIKTAQRLGRGYSFKKLRDRVIGRIPEISNRKKHPGKANVKLKPVSKDWFSELRPAPTRHIDSFFGNSTVRCESPGCRKRVNFTSAAKPDANGDLLVTPIYRYCGPCYDARVDHAGDLLRDPAFKLKC